MKRSNLISKVLLLLAALGGSSSAFAVPPCLNNITMAGNGPADIAQACIDASDDVDHYLGIWYGSCYFDGAINTFFCTCQPSACMRYL